MQEAQNIQNTLKKKIVKCVFDKSLARLIKKKKENTNKQN